MSTEQTAQAAPPPLTPDQMLDEACKAVMGLPSAYNYNWPTNWQRMTPSEVAVYNQKPGLATFYNPFWVKTIGPGMTRDWFINQIVSNNGVAHLIP